jgi:hypothetical protein
MIFGCEFAQVDRLLMRLQENGSQSRRRVEGMRAAVSDGE